MMLRVLAAAALLAASGACSDDPQIAPTADAGPAGDATPPGDATAPDAGPEEDAGSDDAGAPRDAGGTGNPEVIFRGLEPIDGRRLFIEARGTTTSTSNPIVFLSFEPGFGAGYWVPETTWLLGDPANPDRALIYLDLHAQGRSGVADASGQEVSLATQLQSIQSALTFLREQYFGASTRFDVVGHGYGALMAVLSAGQNPDLFERMVLVSPFPADVEDWAEWQANYSFDGRYDGRAIADLEVSPRCDRDRDQCLIEQFRIYGLPWVCVENTQAFFDLGVDDANWVGQTLVEFRLLNDRYDFRPALSAVRAETTVITGDCDQIPESTFELYTSSIPGARRERISTSGFFPMTEAPATFRRLLREALIER